MIANLFLCVFWIFSWRKRAFVFLLISTLFLTPVRSAMEKYMPFAGTHLLPKIIAARHGNDAGLIGAADLVRG